MAGSSSTMRLPFSAIGKGLAWRFSTEIVEKSVEEAVENRLKTEIAAYPLLIEQIIVQFS